MARYAAFSLPLGLALVAFPARAADYYVAPTGSGTTCTMAAPCGRVEDAQTRATGGDTVYIRGGTYTFAASATVGVNFSKSGAANNPIHYFAYMSEIPIFDLSNGQPNARVTGLNVQCSWIHIRGLEVRGVQQYMSGQDSWGVRVQGSNNVIERVNSHHHEAPGFFITSGGNNLILNCDSHHNYDQLESGGSGDGFGCHSSTGGNVMRGCRGYNNSDDGYDFINAPGVCTVEQSWSWSNGYVPDTTTAAGNGAGFKAGGFGSPPTNVPNPVPRHVVRQCIAFGNRAQGFYANHHPGGIDFLNNVAFRNPTNYNMLTDTTSDHHMHNNIAMASGTTISNMVGGTQTSNSWTVMPAVTVNAMDFMSVMESEAGSPRQADGSLPNVGFMHLVAGSDLIDKGEDVGLPFSGVRPDLGPFEFGLTAGTGGMAGAGGRAAGGAAGTGMGGAPGGTAGTAAGGTPGGAAGTPATGGVGGSVAGTTSGGAAGLGTGGTGLPTGGTATGGVATGGTATGGAATGGTATGGTATSGTGSGGVPATGGTSPTAGGTGDLSDDTADEPAGCGCRVGPGRGTELPAILASIVAAAAFARKRRSKRAK